MTYLLFILAILIWPFGQLLNFQLTAGGLNIYPLDLVCGLLTLSLLFSPHRATITKDPLFRHLAIFLLVATMSLVLNITSAKISGLSYSIFYLCRLFIYPSVYFSAKLFPSRKVFPFIVLSLFTFCLLGVVQYQFFPDMRFLKFLGYDDHYFRLIGPFYDPNFAGAVFAGLALFLLSLGQWIFALPTILLLALTFSRASYLVLFLGLIYLLFYRRNWRPLFLLAIFSFLVILIPKPYGEGINLFRTFSIFSRFASWQAGWSLFMQRPLLGWGYNTLRSVTGERFQIDNSFLYLAATTGLVGFIAFGSLLNQVFFYLKSFPLKIFILALLTHSLFNNSLFYIWIYFAFWLSLGLTPMVYKES